MGAGIAPFPAKMLAAVGAAQHRKVEGCGGKSQQDRHRLDGEEIAERLGKHDELHHRKNEIWKKQQLHVLPGRFVHSGKCRRDAAAVRPTVAARGSRPHRFGW